jgi:hypothetical protein
MPEIQLVRRGNALKPKDGDRTLVPQGSTVTFTTEAGVTGTEIAFGGNTPFERNRVSYNTALPVKALFDESDPGKNKYLYKCHGTGPNGEPLDSDGGGGEMEIIQR